MLRPAACLVELVVRRCEGWPYKLFNLINTPEDAQALLTSADAHPCMVDAFSQSIMACYGSVEALQGDEAREVLATTSLQAICSTYSTERLHSSNARRCKAR
eukprot:301410-Amphidinium_carterae.1